jgi:hypothetical protein
VLRIAEVIRMELGDAAEPRGHRRSAAGNGKRSTDIDPAPHRVLALPRVRLLPMSHSTRWQEVRHA